MPAEILANADGFVSMFQTLLGFWRFIFSASYRAKVMERWSKRKGLSQLATIAEAVGGVVIGLILPAIAGYTAFVIATR